MTNHRWNDEGSSFEELDDASLAEVGGAAFGFYGTVGWQVLGQGASYTAAFPS